MPKFTEWYPADTKPVRKGVYEVVPEWRKEKRAFSLWDGTTWHAWDWTVEGAAESRFDGYTGLIWRGLARLPSGEGR